MATHTPRLILGPDDHGRALTAEEYADADFLEPWKYERERGRLVVMSPDSEEHDDRSEPVRDHLGAYRLAHPDLVEKVVSEAWVRVAGVADRIGDIGVYLRSERSALRRPERVPELMFEVVSPDRDSRERDYVTKRREYHRLGVGEYVVIDRFSQRVIVHTRGPRGYRRRIVTPADAYTSPLLPGLAIPLAEVL